MNRIIQFGLFAGTAVWAASSFAAAPQLPADKIDQAVIASLPFSDPDQTEVLTHLDLTQPFSTSSQWSLVVVQDDTRPPEDYGAGTGYEHGAIAVCLVKGLVPTCTEKYGEDKDADMAWASTLYSLFDSKIVYSGDANTQPLLWVQTCSFPSVNTSCGIRSVAYAYDAKQDIFDAVFTYVTGSNNNQNTRFMESGPIHGDIVVNYPTQDAPYTYWIEVYRRANSVKYLQILKYRGHTHYGDGNRLPVIDSEMPATLQHLGLWKPGDPLPIPTLPADSDISCGHPVLRHNEEWCN